MGERIDNRMFSERIGRDQWRIGAGRVPPHVLRIDPGVMAPDPSRMVMSAGVRVVSAVPDLGIIDIEALPGEDVDGDGKARLDPPC
jgi:hypothetical protein